MRLLNAIHHSPLDHGVGLRADAEADAAWVRKRRAAQPTTR
jgi:alpha/beta superfamily hydrolase